MCFALNVNVIKVEAENGTTHCMYERIIMYHTVKIHCCDSYLSHIVPALQCYLVRSELRAGSGSLHIACGVDALCI